MARGQGRWLTGLALPLIIEACGGTVGSVNTVQHEAGSGGSSAMLPEECFCKGYGITDLCPCPPDPTEAGSHDSGTVESGTPDVPCPTYPGWPPPDRAEPFFGDPSEFDAHTFGCYSRVLAPTDWWQPRSVPDCGGNWRCSHEPSDLPCGACTDEGSACGMGVWAACDCGRGRFLESYTDEWVCKCTSGTWDCRVVAPSGSSCFSCPLAIVDAGPG